MEISWVGAEGSDGRVAGRGDVGEKVGTSNQI